MQLIISNAAASNAELIKLVAVMRVYGCDLRLSCYRESLAVARLVDLIFSQYFKLKLN